jgi:hypothetical protein
MSNTPEKLQQLFDAALRDSSNVTKPLARGRPSSPASPATALVPEVARAAAVAEEPTGVRSLPNAGLDDATAEELGALLDERHAQMTKRRRRSVLTTAAVLLLLVGGVGGWFVQSPQRVQALSEAFHDLRSVGDVMSMAESYRSSLDRIATRGQQVNVATAELGGLGSDDDPNFEAEIHAMTGGEEKTVVERNKQLQKTFSKMAEKAEAEAKE